MIFVQVSTLDAEGGEGSGLGDIIRGGSGSGSGSGSGDGTHILFKNIFIIIKRNSVVEQTLR